MENTSKVVVVTGGSGEIGRAICISFAGIFDKVYFTYFTNKSEAKKTLECIINKGSEAFCEKVDVSSYNDVKDFSSLVLGNTKKIDVLVNSAGICDDRLLLRMTEDRWDRVIDVNLKGTFNCIKFFSKSMFREKYGRIVNITSVVGLSGNLGQCNYAASKAGIIGLTKAVAREFADRNITVNAVAPGYIETSMSNRLNIKSDQIIKYIPMARAGNPSEVSNVVSFLASKKASYITGQVINVNGGMYM